MALHGVIALSRRLGKLRSPVRRPSTFRDMSPGPVPLARSRLLSRPSVREVPAGSHPADPGSNRGDHCDGACPTSMVFEGWSSFLRRGEIGSSRHARPPDICRSICGWLSQSLAGHCWHCFQYPIAPMPRLPAAGAPSFAGMSAIIASAVISRAAIEPASCSAVLTTLAGSTMPALIMST